MSTPLPRPKRAHSLRVKLVLFWTWWYRTTWLDKVTIGRFPADMRLMIRCLGRRCPRQAIATAVGPRGVRHLLGTLRGRRYEVGERLRITLTAPGLRPEVAEVIFRKGRLPKIRLLRS